MDLQFALLILFFRVLFDGYPFILSFLTRPMEGVGMKLQIRQQSQEGEDHISKAQGDQGHSKISSDSLVRKTLSVAAGSRPRKEAKPGSTQVLIAHSIVASVVV